MPSHNTREWIISDLKIWFAGPWNTENKGKKEKDAKENKAVGTGESKMEYDS